MKILVLNASLECVVALRNRFSLLETGDLSEPNDWLAKASSEEYACVVLDISSFRSSALDMLGMIKAINKKIGLLIISDRDVLKERIEILRTGADDFLTQPFDFAELVVRVEALLRRVGEYSREDLIYKEVKVDLEAKTAYVNEVEVDLTKKETEMLVYFLRHKHAVVRKDHLMATLSGNSNDNSFNPDVMYAHVKNLKKKLAQAGCASYLKTVYGTGYKWEE